MLKYFKLKSHYLIIGLLYLSSIVKAQTIDTVDTKVQQLPNRNYEIPPRFKDVSLNNYLSNNLAAKITTPLTAYCVVNMFIDSTGKIKNTQILKSLSRDFDRKLLTTIRSIHGLKPAIYLSHNVNVNLVLNIVERTDSVTNAIKIDSWKYYPTAEATDTTEKIFTLIEKAPEYPGGWQAYYNYLGENIVYPQKAKQNNIQGKVILTFVIGKDGHINDLQVLSSPDDDLSIEALRVVRSAPAFIPGIQNGKPVRVQFTIPITFSL